MILELTMINWRGYENQSFSFLSGLNFIMGPNGKGKTSILEAISYALTGQASTGDSKKMLRDPNKPATITLTIEVEKRKYQITRSQLSEKAGEAFLFDLEENTQIASTHSRVTKAIEKIIGVSSDFLRRIIYMAEGDVFRFIDKPPAEIMNSQVRQVLGLTHLDQFQKSIQLAKRELFSQMKALKILEQRMVDLNISNDEELESQISEITKKRNAIKNKILELESEITFFSSEVQALDALNREIRNNLPGWKSKPRYWSRMEALPLLVFFEELKTEFEETVARISLVEKELSRLIGQRESLKKILDLLSEVGTHINVLCPVCKKPMSSEEQHSVESETKLESEKIIDELRILQSELNRLNIEKQEINQLLESIREIRNDLVHNRYLNLQPDISINLLIDAVNSKIENFKLRELRLNQEELNKQVEQLDRTLANYISFQSQLQNLGFHNPSELQDTQIKIEERSIALSAADDAVDRTLADMRDIDMVAIYEQIAVIWKNFIKYGNWHLKLDPEGKPILHQEGSRDFDFNQFSGGEKTALLVMVHTIISHHFSKCNFLMIDEPLEHLDPINRRSLVGFFIAASQNNFFDQALITTYEESLVRKYISKKNVNIIYIN